MAKLLSATLGLICVWALQWPANAQTASESRAFKAAVEKFEDGIYAQAEKELGEFVRGFPASTLIPDAILYQARAAIEQQKFTVAVNLLKTNAATTILADRYRYWLADAYLQSSNYPAAAVAFGSLSKAFPGSTLLLEASYGEALARFRLGDWPRVVELLQEPNRTFRKEAFLRPADEFAIRGALLLAEALFEQKDYRAATAGLDRLAEEELNPEFKWRRRYLLCRLQVADQHLPEALASTTNLLALAVASSERNLLAESVALQGGILEQLGQFDAAVLVYEKNLGGTVPAERARQAWLKICELTLAQDKVAAAAEKLEGFLARHPDDPASDVAFLALGELHLKQHFAGVQTNQVDSTTNAAPAATNQLQQALMNFERVVTNFPQSALVGKAQLDKGWALWADGRIAQSQGAFKSAVEQLPHSEEQAVARFKLAEAQFSQKDFTNALVNFRLVLTGYSDLRPVKEALFDQALYQIVRSSLELGDLAGAEDAMKKILEWYPNSFFGDRSMLLVGQHVASSKTPSDARRVFRDLVQRYPDSALAPQIELAIARTFAQEKEWPAVIGAYEHWLEHFPTNDLRAQVEFDRASATSQAGDATNALVLFTNFVARFSTDALAPLAQYWVGSFYYNQKDYVSAEANFQDKIFLQSSNYYYQAVMMAGRAATARQAYADAEKYFAHLIDDVNCPPAIKAEAYFAFGDTLTLLPPEPGKKLPRFDEAIVVLSKIPSLFPTNPLVARALGRIGDCYLQLATLDSKQYDNVTNFYERVVQMNTADVAARSEAEVRLGFALEAMARLNSAENAALLDAAFEHYTNVIYEKNLRDGESPDPSGLKAAGLAAGKLAEERKQWEIAIKLYTRLRTRLPLLRDFLAKRINNAREQWGLEKN